MITFEHIDQLAQRMRDGAAYVVPSDDELERLARRYVEPLTRSSVLRQYIQHIKRPGYVANTLPWHAEGERQYAQIALLDVGMPGGTKVVRGDTLEYGGREEHAAVFAAGTIIQKAELFQWRTAVEDTADASELPRHIISRTALPHACMFWSRETRSQNTDLDGLADWIFIVHTAQGIRVLFPIQFNGGNTGAIVDGTLPYGATYPDDFPKAITSTVYDKVLKRLAFLNSPYTETKTERIPRAWRREAIQHPERAPNPDPAVRVIQLRAAKPGAKCKGDDSATRKWRGHWWVRAHYRAQWFPSEKAHHVIWIPSHLKGNLDGPLLKHMYSVER